MALLFSKTPLGTLLLLSRWQTGAALNAPDANTFYTPGPKGYVDYPKLGASVLSRASVPSH